MSSALTRFSQNPTLQALEVIKQLKESIPIARAQMRIKLFVPKEFGKKVREKLIQHIGTIESEEWDSGALDMVGLIFNQYKITVS